MPEHVDLIAALMVSRDRIHPHLDADLLEAIVRAEADALDDPETAMRAIDRVVSAGLARGIGEVLESKGRVG